MSCKYKRLDGTDGIHPWCKITGGECQFLVGTTDMDCPILEAYPKDSAESSSETPDAT